MDLFHFPQPLTTSQFPPTGPPPPPQHAPTAALEIAHKMHLMLSNPTTLAIPSWQSLLSGQHPSLAHGHYHPLLTSSANLPSAFPSLVGHCDRPSLRDNNDMVASNHDGHLPSLSANNSNDNHHHRLLQHHQRRPSVDSGLEPSNGSVTSSVEQLNTNSNSNATMNALTSSSSSTSISSLHHESIATSSSVPTSSYFSANSTTTNSTFLDVHKGKAIRLRVKVLVPVHDHPNFNFIGKLLGPRGASLKWLQESTQTKMAILGKGSMRDKNKEEELRRVGDPKKYGHLHEDLHVEITAYAPAPEAYTRMGKALQEVKRFLVPDYYDDIRQQQLKELGIIIPSNNKTNGGLSTSSRSSSSDDGDMDHMRSTISSPSMSSVSSVTIMPFFNGSSNGNHNNPSGTSVKNLMACPSSSKPHHHQMQQPMPHHHSHLSQHHQHLFLRQHRASPYDIPTYLPSSSFVPKSGLRTLPTSSSSSSCTCQCRSLSSPQPSPLPSETGSSNRDKVHVLSSSSSLNDSQRDIAIITVASSETSNCSTIEVKSEQREMSHSSLLPEVTNDNRITQVNFDSSRSKVSHANLDTSPVLNCSELSNNIPPPQNNSPHDCCNETSSNSTTHNTIQSH